MPLIIYVDDDPDDFNLFQEAVNEVTNQCIVRYASCNKEFYDLLNKVSPQLIFLDINMHEEDGISWLKKLRSQKKYDTIPIIMYTTSSDHIDECYKYKASFYIKKPQTYFDIISALKKVLLINWATFYHPTRENFVIS